MILSFNSHIFHCSSSSLPKSWLQNLTQILLLCSRTTGKPGKPHRRRHPLSFVQNLCTDSKLVPESVCIIKVIISICQTQHSGRLTATCASAAHMCSNGEENLGKINTSYICICWADACRFSFCKHNKIGISWSPVCCSSCCPNNFHCRNQPFFSLSLISVRILLKPCFFLMFFMKFRFHNIISGLKLKSLCSSTNTFVMKGGEMHIRNTQ